MKKVWGFDAFQRGDQGKVQVEQNVVFELAQVEKKRITCVSSCTPLHTAPVFRISKTV